METLILVGFGVPIALLVTAFVVLATWMQVTEQTQGKA